jgi:hypothetical protein
VYGVPGDPTNTRDVTAKVQAIVDGGEMWFVAWRLGERDNPGMQMLKTLDVDYTLVGKPCRTVILNGQTACLDDVADPAPTARIQAEA